ncbi:MAG: hypothetical protein CMJ58_28705 [Planctomycetaceae bacterium]|nr:hypothetical protein [Planctomycetaceae bacterium]
MAPSHSTATQKKSRPEKNDQVTHVTRSEFARAVERVIHYLQDAEEQDYDCRHEPGQPHIYESVLVLKRWLDAASRNRPAS